MNDLRRIGWGLGGVAALAAWMGPACSSPMPTGNGAVGAHCTAGTECNSHVCTNSACTAGTCADGVQNGDETNIDCGGSCPPCGDGETCSTGADCASKICTAGLCAASSCTDAIKNGNESDVDCGGSCGPCPAGKQCGAPADCVGGSCSKGVCTSCTDGIKNGNESDVDCGGACGPCAAGKHCGGPADCATGSCSAGVCAGAGCTDGVKNGDESDVDCGGSCPGCPPGKHCGAAADCASLVCTAGACVASTCTDGVKNGTESDVDCGGSCPSCPLGKACATGADCNQAACKGSVCTTAQSCNDLHTGNPALSDGVYTVDFDGPGGMAPLPVYCDMTTSGGGWTALLNPAMTMGLPAATVPLIATQTSELSGMQTCGSPPPVQAIVGNNWNGFAAYACGNVTFRFTLTWPNPIGAKDVLVLAVVQGDTTHTLVVNNNPIPFSAGDPGGNCFAWDAMMSPPSAGTGCWKAALAAPPQAYIGKISGALDLQMTAGPGGMGPNNMVNFSYGTGLSLQRLLVR